MTDSFQYIKNIVGVEYLPYRDYETTLFHRRKWDRRENRIL